MRIKSVLLTSVILLCYLVFFGQTRYPYDSQWKLIDSLIQKKNLPKSALAEVNKLYAAARKENQEAQWVKAVIYRNYLEAADENRNINQDIQAMQSEILPAPAPVAALLQSVEAEKLYQYLLGNMYSIRNRTAISGDTSSDITTWTKTRLDSTIRVLYLSSLSNPQLLQKTPVSTFDPVIIKGNSRNLRPTLYDLLAWRALEYFQANNSFATYPADDSLMQNEILFSAALPFSRYSFSDKYPVSRRLDAIKIYQQLLKFHERDSRKDAWTDVDIARIQFVYQQAQTADKDSLYLAALRRITGEFSKTSAASQAWFLEAQWWSGQAASYEPFRDTLHRYDYLKAVEICKNVSAMPAGEGRANCENLLKNIETPDFKIQTEEVNVPDQPFRILVSYKNLTGIYGRIIKLNDTTRKLFDENNYDPKSWSKWLNLTSTKTFHQLLPDTKDYQQHRVELGMDALPAGQYALLTSSDESFSGRALMGLSIFYCSSIAFVKNENDYFVVDRDSGQPLPNVNVKSYSRKYTNSGYTFIYQNAYQTDKNGFFHLIPAKNFDGGLRLDFSTGHDVLSTNGYINYYRNNSSAGENGPPDYESTMLQDYFYTDRSIYRPGQTVFFKGILITRDRNTKKYKPAEQRQVKIFLTDANNQHVDSLFLKSNDFGSFQGKFTLPLNTLNGEFSISDDSTGNDQTFSVEEYKRPKFYISYDTLKKGYQVNDAINLSGTAMAYAGNSISGAKVSWRVFRESRFPYPWLFRFYPSSSEQQIAFGESNTDENGKFRIQFNAIPDKSVSRSSKPIFTYRIETTITDIAGESRSGTTTVSVSYQSFQINSDLPETGRLSRDSLYRIPVTTRNLSGEFIRKSLTVSIYPLSAPGRLIRKRYWEQPDQFVLSQAEFIKLFPNDEYQDETNVKSWKLLRVVFQKTDSSQPDGFFIPGKNTLTALAPGWYEFEFKARDVTGDIILDKKYIEVTDSYGAGYTLNYNQIPFESKTTEPGSPVTIKTGSGASDLFVIRSRQNITDTAAGYSFFKIMSGVKETTLDVQESDRGGFALNDVFIKNNRWYVSEHLIQVPWTNKELQVSYETWKDKTLPGSREQWKIRISGSRKDQVSAELLTSMYDASLDLFKPQRWTVPDIYPVYSKSNGWSSENNFTDKSSTARPQTEVLASVYFEKNYDALISFNTRSGIMIRGMASGIVNKNVQDMALPAAPEYKKELAGAVQSVQLEKPEPKPQTDENSSGADNQIRKNFSETAFFIPDLKTDEKGNVEISFTMPDALTRWKWMVLANTKDLSFGFSEKQIITQKEFMIQTNMPRFFREGDTVLLPVKIANLSQQSLSGTISLAWQDAMELTSVDQIIGNAKNNQSFTVPASQTSVVFFPVVIPTHFTQPLVYRVIAKAASQGISYSDGEENIIPVLSNRMLVTESLPLNMNGKTEAKFSFEKLIRSGAAATLQNQSLTVEYTSNPAWYGVQSLPYLMEYPYECAEQTFNRFYANALAFHIVQVSPAIKAIFNKWKNTDTSALLSNLQKNQELKSVLLRETPWVLQAQSETQQKKNLALLFDLIKMQEGLKSSMDKLQQMQSEAGGFPWFKDGRDDQYITQYIISGIGRLRKLNAIPDSFQKQLDVMTRSAIGYLDKEISKEYEKRDRSPRAVNLNSTQIQYLYMRSFYSDIAVPGNIFPALNYYRKQAIQGWTTQPVLMQGMIALFLNRTGEKKTAGDILASLKENATNSVELGMYWKTNRYGYYWQEAPVETQALLIETFSELQATQKEIDQMKFWLLQQKRTNHWPTTKATADATYALLLAGSDWLASQQTVSVRLGDYTVNSDSEKTEAGTGYFKKQISGSEVRPAMGNIEVVVGHTSSVISHPSWGAVYWQYFEDLDKIAPAQTQLFVSKKLFIERNSDKGSVLNEISGVDKIKPGDKLRMRIIIKTDRDLEYVHLKDMRAACLEPVSVLSGYQSQDGLGYYQTTQDASTSFFFDRLPKGDYVLEYPVFATTAGNYSNGITSLECMYAPEFAAHSAGVRLEVAPK